MQEDVCHLEDKSLVHCLASRPEIARLEGEILVNEAVIVATRAGHHLDRFEASRMQPLAVKGSRSQPLVHDTKVMNELSHLLMINRSLPSPIMLFCPSLFSMTSASLLHSPSLCFSFSASCLLPSGCLTFYVSDNLAAGWSYRWHRLGVIAVFRYVKQLFLLFN